LLTTTENIMNWRRRTLLALVVLFGGAQIVPYGRAHGNPPVVAEPQWSSPDVRALAQRACFDCHSNESRWPWYSHVAPISWLVQRDVDEGRAALNFSEWNRPQEEAGEAADAVIEQEMPPAIYLPLHADARLTHVERAALVDGLRAMFGNDAGPGEDESD
jgi:hypothetical protein